MTVKYRRELMEWQFIGRYWWHLWLFRVRYSADEYGPAEEFVFFGPLQWRYALWRVD